MALKNNQKPNYMKKLKINKYIFRNITLNSYDIMRFQSAEILKFIEKNASEFEDASRLMQAFHNDKIQYAGIQLASEQHRLAITAYGKSNIKAVETWWKVYRKKNKLSKTNVVKTQENYELQYSPEAYTYKISKMLIKKDKYEQLSRLKNNTARFNSVLAAYITANFLPLYNMIDHWHDRQKNDIQVQIVKAQEHLHGFKVYKNRYRQGFDIVFTTRLLLPYNFAIGESTALGFGRINMLK